jgi:hypothetical protein
MERFLSERDRLPNNRICDIHYAEIRREPIRAVRRIYEFFGWSLSREAEQNIRVLIASQAKRESANHRYDLSQFGADADEVLSAFVRYCEQFGLSHSTHVRHKRTTRRLSHMIESQQLGHDV